MHWFMRIGDCVNFENSIPSKAWGCKKNSSKSFLQEIKKGDIIWFVPNQDKSGLKGKIFYCAEYQEHFERVLGPLLALTPTNEELGWKNIDNWNSDWDVQIFYRNLYKIDNLNLQINISGRQTPKGKLLDEMCENFNPNDELKNIIKYLNIQKLN